MYPRFPFLPLKIAILSTFSYLKSRNNKTMLSCNLIRNLWMTDRMCNCNRMPCMQQNFRLSHSIPAAVVVLRCCIVFIVVCPHHSGTNLFNGSLINVVLLQFNGVFLWAHMICHCVCARAVHSLFTRYILNCTHYECIFFLLEKEEEKDAEIRTHIAHMPFVFRFLFFFSLSNNTTSFANSILRCCAFVWYALLLRGLSVLVYLCIHLFIFQRWFRRFFTPFLFSVLYSLSFFFIWRVQKRNRKMTKKMCKTRQREKQTPNA